MARKKDKKSKMAKRNLREQELNTPPPLEDEDVINLSEEHLLSDEEDFNMNEDTLPLLSEEFNASEQPQEQVKEVTGSEENKEQRGEPRKPPRGEPSKPQPSVPSPDEQEAEKRKFIEQMMAIGAPPQQAKRRKEEPARQQDLRKKLGNNGKASNKPTDQPQPSTSAAAMANDAQPTMASVIRGRADLLQLASNAVAGQQVYPLLQAFLTGSDVPRNPREAAVRSLWDSRKPRIYSIMVIAGFHKDPVPGYTRAYEIVLHHPRSVETVIHLLTERSEIILDFLYGLHAQRVLLTPATAKHMLTYKNVIGREGAFYHLYYSTCDEKIMGRDEALITPQLIDLKPRGTGYMLKVNLRLYGKTTNFGPQNAAQDARYHGPARHLLREADQHETYVSRVKAVLNQ